VLRGELLRADLLRCQERIEEQRRAVLAMREKVSEKLSSQKESMVKHSEMLISEIKNQIGELVANCDLIMQE